MASGSTAPFSGEFVDLENVPNLPEGISAEQIFEQNADAIRQAAEARHAAGLSQINADGGFFDAFVDNSKTSSSSSISFSGIAKLGFNFDIDDFENGIDSGWSGDLANLSTTTNTVLQGSQSGLLTSSNNFVGVDYVKTVDKSDLFLKLNFNSLAGSGDDLAILLRNGSSTFANIRFEDDTKEIKFFNGSSFQNVANFSKGQTLDFEIKTDFANNQVEIIINGVSKGTFSSSGSLSQWNKVLVESDTRSSGGSRDVVLDALRTSKVSLKTSGKITEKQFTFTDTQGNSFSPSKVGIFPEQTLNGQSITYDLKDSTGTIVKTFNQADLNQLQSVNTTDTTFQVEANFSGNGSQTPELEFLDVRGV